MGADEYEDDEGHPIARVRAIDVETKLKGGGAYYGLVIASPLAGDQRSQNRLLQKLQAYVDDFHSPEFLERSGRPSPQNCHIYVEIHPDSDPVIFELLEKCRQWVERNGITFVIETDFKTPH